MDGFYFFIPFRFNFGAYLYSAKGTMAGQNIYFFSDFHLGRPALHSSDDRQQLIIECLDRIKDDASKIYFVGDLFDYWYEYKHAIPIHFTPFIATLYSLKNAGIEIEIFTGNHDLWMFGFFQNHLGIPVHKDPIEITAFGKTLFVGHGDGLGPGDYGYKFIKKIFRNSVCQWLFSRVHPNAAIGIMKFFSNQSRKVNENKPVFIDFKDEWLVQFCESYHPNDQVDYFVFGHRHLPMKYKLESRSGIYFNLGDSLYHYTYGILTDEGFSLEQYYDTGTSIKTNI